MKSTKGESTKKTKTAIKARGTTKKASKKKQINRKKAGDTKKTLAILRSTETGESVAKKKRQKKVGDTKKATTSKRRSNRNRNSNLNYNEELSEDLNSSADEKSGNDKGKNTKKQRKRRKDDQNSNKNATSEENWQVYDRGSLDNDDTWNEHYYRLQEFHSQHGHSAVPTHIVSNDEPEFADWVTRQKQLFREIRNGYRMASSRDERRWRRLQVLQFPLDYEQWLWERKYNELCKILNGEKLTNRAILPTSLTEWVEQQKEFAKYAAHGGSRINSERRTNLEKLGVLTRDVTNSSGSTI